MTVATQTRSWQNDPPRRNGVGNPPTVPPAAPSLFPVLAYLRRRWGGVSVSAPSMMTCRPVTGGTAPSSHCGAAFDWQYGEAHGGPGEARVRAEVLPFLISWSLELNIQQLHHYTGSRVWKASRSGDSRGGWAQQSVGSHGGAMGKPGNTWLHIEAGEWGWFDGRSVEEKLGDDEVTPQDIEAIAQRAAQLVWERTGINAVDGQHQPMADLVRFGHGEAHRAAQAAEAAVAKLTEDASGKG